MNIANALGIVTIFAVIFLLIFPLPTKKEAVKHNIDNRTYICWCDGEATLPGNPNYPMNTIDCANCNEGATK